MAIMCNLSHDVCCDLVMLEHTGALDSILQQVTLTHQTTVLCNACYEKVETPAGVHIMHGVASYECLRVPWRLTDIVLFQLGCY